MCDLCITVDHRLLRSKSSDSSVMFPWSPVLFIDDIFYFFFMFQLLFVLEPTSYCRNSTMSKLCTAVLKFEPRSTDELGLTGFISTNRTNRGRGGSNFPIFVVKLFSALHVSIFQSFSALISFSCWVVFIIINMIIVMIIIIAAAAALWLL